MKVTGILGGTFDPPHNAHYEIAQRAINQYNLDRVIFIPTGSPWQKDIETSYEDRQKMTKLLINSNPLFELSDIEKSVNEPSYTIETLKKLNIEKENLFFILGADVAISIDTWKNYEEIHLLTNFLVAPREEISKEKLVNEFPFEFNLIEGDELDISSTQIRNKIISKESIEGELPQKIHNYIKENELY
jgi:nicotinate-nucleotide adenylyltransferase